MICNSKSLKIRKKDAECFHTPWSLNPNQTPGGHLVWDRQWPTFFTLNLLRHRLGPSPGEPKAFPLLGVSWNERLASRRGIPLSKEKEVALPTTESIAAESWTTAYSIAAAGKSPILFAVNKVPNGDLPSLYLTASQVLLAEARKERIASNPFWLKGPRTGYREANPPPSLSVLSERECLTKGPRLSKPPTTHNH